MMSFRGCCRRKPLMLATSGDLDSMTLRPCSFQKLQQGHPHRHSMLQVKIHHRSGKFDHRASMVLRCLEKISDIFSISFRYSIFKMQALNLGCYRNPSASTAPFQTSFHYQPSAHQRPFLVLRVALVALFALIRGTYESKGIQGTPIHRFNSNFSQKAHKKVAHKSPRVTVACQAWHNSGAIAHSQVKGTNTKSRDLPKKVVVDAVGSTHPCPKRMGVVIETPLASQPKMLINSHPTPAFGKRSWKIQGPQWRTSN